MDIDKLRQSVIEKINNNNFKFTVDEIAILQTNFDIFMEFLKKIIYDEKLLEENFEIAISIIDNLDIYDEDIDPYFFEYLPILEEKYYYFELKQKHVEIDMEKLFVEDEYFKSVLYVLNNRNDIGSIRFSGDTLENREKIIKKLLDRKEYYAISRIINKFGISFTDKNFFDRLLKEFPFNEYNINILSLANTTYKDDFDEVIYQNLDKLNFANLRKKYASEQDEAKQQKILEVISKKLNDEHENLNFFFDDRRRFREPENSLKNYIPKNFNQKITLNNLSIVLNYDIELNDEQINIVCNLIKDTNIDLTLNNKFIIDNDKIINALIDSGNYDNLNYDIQKKKKEYFTETIFNAYKNNNTKLLARTKINLFNPCHMHIMEKLMKEKYFKLFVHNYDSNNFGILRDELFTILTETIENLTTDEILANPIMMRPEFPMKYIEKLMNEKEYDKVALLNFPTYDNVLKQNKKSFAELISNSFNCAVRLLNRNADSVFSIEEFRNAYLSYNYDYFNEKILNFLLHAENDSLYNEQLYVSVKSLLINKYHLNETNLDYMINKYGYILIKYIDNQSIQSIINLDDDKFNKFVKLFPQEPYKMNDLETIYDSFKQEEFTKLYPDIINIFPDIMHSLDNGSKDYFSYLDNLCEVWNETLIDKILKKYPDEERVIQNNPDYIVYIGNIITSNDAITKDRYTNILHIITDYYIAQKREQYRKTYDIYKEASIPFEYDKKDLDKIVTARTLQECIIYNQVSDYYKSELYRKIVNDLIENGLSESEAKDSILLAAQKKFITRIERNQYFFFNILTQKYGEFLANSIIEEYKNKIDKLNSNSDLKKNIGLVNKITLPYLDSYVYAAHSLNGTNLDDLDIDDVKKKYYLKESNLNVFELFSNIRMDLFEENVLNNDEVYDSLKRIIKKYKLDSLAPEVDNIVSKEIFDLSCNTSDIATFISFFHSIYETEKSNLQAQGKNSNNLSISIMNIFKYLDKYSAVSSIYSQILGKEDEGLVRSNPKPNAASGFSKEERLKKAVEKTFKNFEKKDVKVPTFNHNVTLSNGKLMTAIVGNFTKTTNITHGERTGACMRIGGAGYSLFDSDEIFHIEFNEPATGKYISRVTGFRNGNTVFLNELRFSCDTNLYSNLEVVEACKIVAQELIDRSKDSTCPIENVVIHRDYAMNETKDNRVQLNISNNKKGLKPFYSDVGNLVQVLATTAEEGFVPVDLDNSKVPSYLPSREKIRSGSSSTIVEQINRLYTISLGLKGQYYYVNPIATDIVYGYVGEDWYVFINEQNEIICDRIDRDERSIIEYEFAINEIKKHLNTISEKENGYAI